MWFFLRNVHNQLKRDQNYAMNVHNQPKSDQNYATKVHKQLKRNQNYAIVSDCRGIVITGVGC